MRKSKDAGFTLIELLVVISIIGMLIGMLMPSLAGVRNTAVSVKCKSNLRQVGLAMQSYLQDFDECLPNAKFMPSPVASGDKRVSFNQAMKGYWAIDKEGRNEIYRCDGDDVLYDTCGSSYAYEIWFRARKLKAITREWEGMSISEIWLMSDYEPGNVDLEDGEKVTVGMFHKDVNVVFADGHVMGLGAEAYKHK